MEKLREEAVTIESSADHTDRTTRELWNGAVDKDCSSGYMVVRLLYSRH